MKKTLSLIILFFLLAISFILIPRNISAQITNPALSSGVAGQDAAEFISNVLSAILQILLAAGAVFFLFLFVFGAYKWMSSGGDKANLQKAKEHITHALVGLVILLCVFVISSTVFCFFGIGPCTGGGFSLPTPVPTLPPSPTPTGGIPTPSISPLCGQECITSAECGANHICWAEGEEQRHCYSDACSPWIQTNCLCPPPTATPIPTRAPRTWTISGEAICDNGVIDHSIFPAWIDFLPRTDHIDIGGGSTTTGHYQTTITTSLTSVTFHLLADPYGITDNAIPLRGSPPHSNISYGTYWNIPGAHWNTDNLPEGTYEINFTAPSSWCVAPSPTPSQEDCYYSGGYCWIFANYNMSCANRCANLGLTCSTNNWNDDSNCTIMRAILGTANCNFCSSSTDPSAPRANSSPYLPVCQYRDFSISSSCTAYSPSSYNHLCACE